MAVCMVANDLGLAKPPRLLLPPLAPLQQGSKEFSINGPGFAQETEAVLPASTACSADGTAAAGALRRLPLHNSATERSSTASRATRCSN